MSEENQQDMMKLSTEKSQIQRAMNEKIAQKEFEKCQIEKEK